jgi:hypothetical protein
MDRFYWLPEWQGRSDEDFYALLEETLNATPGWVLDGNYNRSRPIKWRDVDLVIWLDYGFWRTLRQAVLRVIRRAWQEKSFGRHRQYGKFPPRILKPRVNPHLDIKTWRHNRVRYAADMANPQYQHIRFVRLTSPQQVDTFLASLT